MSAMASQITSLSIVYSSAYSDTDESKYQSSAPLAFARGIHGWPVNSPHKGPVTRKMFPFGDVIMNSGIYFFISLLFIYTMKSPKLTILVYFWLEASDAFSLRCKEIRHAVIYEVIAVGTAFRLDIPEVPNTAITAELRSNYNGKEIEL